MGQVCVCIASGFVAPCGDLHHVLNQQSDLDVVVAGGKQLLSLVAQIRPDVVLLDEGLIDSQHSIVTSIHASSPTTLILVFNGERLGGSFIVRTLLLGVRGLITKEGALDLYAKAIRTVHAGGLWLERQALEAFLLRWGATEPGSESHPTPRESEIIACVRHGMTNKEAARHLGISEKTVKVHLNHIYSKLGVSRRMHLILPFPFAVPEFPD